MAVTRQTFSEEFKIWEHRTATPEQTYARLQSAFETVSITRVADITDLDVLGIPIFQAVRPLGRSLTVSQGKGLSKAAAQVSAVMEAIEIWHAETSDLSGFMASLSDLCGRPAIPPSMLGKPGAVPPEADTAVRWTPARDMISDTTVLVPADVANLDFTRDALPACLARSTTGLAGGNTFHEAVASALAEVIERACEAEFLESDRETRRARRLEGPWPDTLCEAIRHMLDRIESANLRLDLYDITNRFGVPCIRAELYGSARKGQSLNCACGHGAHLDPVTAVTRAITEAAQGRLAYISGNRDDLDPRFYYGGDVRNLLRLVSGATNTALSKRDFSLDDQSTSTPEGDVDVMLGRIAHEQAGPIALIDLTRPDLCIPVVKIVAPNISHLACK